jgi:hypothetical protein
MTNSVVNEIQFCKFLIRRTACWVFIERRLFETSVKLYRIDAHIIVDKLSNMEYLVSLFHRYFSIIYLFTGKEGHRREAF